MLRFLRRHRGDLDDYALATKKVRSGSSLAQRSFLQYFTASLEMLNQIERTGMRGAAPLSEELRAALAKRKASQELIHKTMSEYLDLILAERVRRALSRSRTLHGISYVSALCFLLKAIPLLHHRRYFYFVSADAPSQNELLELIDMVRPTTLDAFNKKWIPHIEDTARRLSSTTKDAPAQCIICTDNVANATLKRSCGSNDLHFNCEGQVRAAASLRLCA